ncbi:MAG: hypothetical protein EOO50_05365 [Flavobacterium sp.]|uniref:hypothetical protein n=1 Tax=Flavobacterium sp. TaxID=239 RepID=UPI001210077B|nr:hypothetical protein [Flavobacterium sp.]RZJ67417.1 MAG: hypothetical protein EOO50_05365 [Flavobacterium sp.]
MSKPKIIVAFVLFLLGIGVIQAQETPQGQADPKSVFKFLTTGYSVMERDPNGKWGGWSELKPTSLVVTLDTKKGRIIVYSQEVQLFDILNYEQVKENDEDLIYPFSCTDDDGRPFTISFITRKKQNNRKQLYITTQDVVLMYNINNFPDKNIEVK